MKKYILPILLTLLLGFVTISATAQSWIQKFDFGITYSSIDKQDKLASVFNLLASNDNKNVNNLNLQLSFEMHFSIVKTRNGKVILKYSGYNQKMTGTVFFRDFKVDSLLLPEKLDVDIQLYENNRLTDTLTRTISFAKGEHALSLPKGISISALSVKIKVNRVVYTSNQYYHFLQVAGLINNYYGYVKIMQEMPQLLMKTSGERPPASGFFLNYIALTRLESYVRQHNFSLLLHLKLRDPLNFEEMFGEMLRLQIRMRTLSQQILNGNIPAGLTDKENFTRGYVALSNKAVALSKEQQPYIAASFNEFTRVFPDNREKDFVSRVSAFYDKDIKPGQATVSQEIYKYFIDAASLKIRQKSYVRALDFLANAAYFENRFPKVKRITEFDSCLIHARDGLATSYLKVALMAAENNDLQLTNSYINKASQSLKTYSNLIKPPASTPCYLHYSRVMRHMAETSLKQGYFHKTLKLLNTANQACQKLPDMDSLLRITCKQLLRHRLDVSKKLLEQGDITASQDTLLQIAKDYPGLCSHNLKLTQNKEVIETATTIFQQTITKGAQLHDQNRNTQAMINLSSAAQLQKIFSLPDSPQLNRLIAETTVPYILAIAKKANLEIWRKHFQKADSIYRLTQTLSRHYGVAENQEIKHKLDALSVKIKVAGCQWEQEEIVRLFSQTKRAVRAYQMAAAKSHFLKAKKLYAGAGSCHQNKKQADSIFQTYEDLFQFTDQYHALTQRLFEKGFAAVLPDFVRLDQQYHAGHLEQFGLSFTGLYPFIKSQHSESIILKTVHYFIRDKNFAQAIRYLQLADNPAKAKAEQKQIALGLVRKNIRPQSHLLTQPAWASFAKTYRKALSAKGK